MTELENIKSALYQLNADYRSHEDDIDLFFTNVIMLDVNILFYDMLQTNEVSIRYFSKKDVLLFETAFHGIFFRIYVNEHTHIPYSMEETLKLANKILLEVS